MIITEGFVYIHLPKTGGSFVENVLNRLYRDQPGMFVDTATSEGRAWVGSGTDQHQTVGEIPASYRNLPVLFTVRNPFDHHVSFYEFGWWKTHPGDTFNETLIRRALPHYPELSFTEYLEAFYDWQLLHPDHYPGGLEERLATAGIGPLSWEYLRFLFDDPKRQIEVWSNRESDTQFIPALNQVHFLRQDRLNRDLHDFLLGMGHSRASLDFILEMPRIYPDTKAPRRASRDWATYYTAALLALVRRREAWLFTLLPQYDKC